MTRRWLLLLAVPLLGASLTEVEEDPRPSAMASLVAASAQSRVAYDRLGTLSNSIGHRLSGSPQLEQAVAWSAEEMRADGLTVQLQELLVPAWIRGDESVLVTAPVERELAMLGLGNSVGGDVSAELVVVGSFEALDEVEVEGRIVLYDVPFTTYGETVQFRSRGPYEAASRGALGVLVRSVTPESLYTPHTGATHRAEAGEPTVPAAAITVEDAAWLHALVDAGERVTVRLRMEAHFEEDRVSHNVIADLPGRELPQELVVVGCHLDSWDVGQGAQDDGVGCLIAWEAARLMKQEGLVPRRTVRVVLYTNEENGLRGGAAYAEAFGGLRHVAAFESDTGNGRADGFRVDLRMEDAEQRHHAQGLVWELESLLEPHGGGRLRPGYSGADIGPLAALGVPSFGLNHDTTTYWPIHHTEADTFDKIVLEDLQHNAGLMAAAVWAVAEAPETLVNPSTKTRTRR